MDNQAAFAEVFGDDPKILASNPVMSQDTTTTDRSLYSFGKKFKFGVIMHMCRKYYVGHDSVDKSLSVQDVSRQISEIKQECENKNGILMQGRPDELFDKFLYLSIRLPESDRAWTIQLYAAYFAALVR